MNETQIAALYTLLFVIIIVAGILLIWFLILTGIWWPIKKKDEHNKQMEEERKELQEIQVAKGVEWDKYKEQSDELDKLRKAYFHTKGLNDQAKEETAKLQNEKDKLVTRVRELNKSLKQAEGGSSENTKK